jgi:DNA-directed RNA polymerase subunit RPC12/RpoP
MDHETVQTGDVLQLPCPSCGGKMRYSAEKQKIACQYCGYTEEIDKANDLIVEQPLDATITMASSFVPENQGRKVFDCDNCGSKFMIEATEVAVNCTFCGSNNVNVEAFVHQYIQPSGIIPFKVAENQGLESFQKWLRQGIFHPNSLKRLAKVENLHGIYLPFFTYDANTVANWSGEAGFHYTETRKVRVNGQMQTQTVTKTRWVPKSGTLRHFFDDVLVVASNGLKQKEITAVYPFLLDEAVNYDPKLLLGWEAEVYSLTLEEGAQVSEQMMDEELRQMASRALGGDTQRRLRVVSKKFDKTYKHIILPIWLATYVYKDKVYHFVVNGQTGKISGKKPLSWLKIAFAVLLFVGFLATLYYLRETGVFMG